MKYRGSGLRISVQDLIDWSEEASALSGQGTEPIDRRFAVVQDEHLRGRFDAYVLRPGLTLFLLDLYVRYDTEIRTAVPELRAGFGLNLEGSAVRSLTTSSRGEAEMQGQGGFQFVSSYPPGTWSLKLKGGQAHKMVKLRLAKAHVPELIDAYDANVPPLLGHILLPSGPASTAVSKALSPTLQILGYQVLHCPFRGATRRLFMEGKGLEILACELEEFGSHPPGPALARDHAETERLYDARRIVEDEFTDPPTLADLARRAGLNDFKLKRGFRELFGTTVFEHVRRLRMEWARSLLEQGQLSVTEVALTTGYSHLGHFSAAFKRSFGVLPSQYRRRRGGPTRS